MRKELDDTRDYIQKSVIYDLYEQPLKEYWKQRRELLKMEREYSKKDNLTDDEIYALNWQTDYVRNLGNNIVQQNIPTIIKKNKIVAWAVVWL